jgi:DNA-binding NarL/FixJ family response regulator
MIVDDHPAMRAGLTTVLEQESDLVPVGAAPGVFEAQAMYEETRPNVVMLDFHLPGQSSLGFARHVKSRMLPARVVVYSAHAGPTVALAAALAGADAMVSKEASARELLLAVREVAAGGSVLPPASELLATAADNVPADDLPMTAMLLHGSSVADVAQTQGVDPKSVDRHLTRVLSALEPEPSRA